MTVHTRGATGFGRHVAGPSDQGEDWRTRAVCRDEDPELFFPIGDGEPARLQEQAAQAVCRRCPVQRECGTWAVESGQRDGVWAAMTERQLRSAIRARKTKPETRGAKPQPCGTSAAYQRHRAHGEEPCAPCKQARAEDLAARKAKREATR